MPDGLAAEPAVTRARRSQVQDGAVAQAGTPAVATDSSRMAAPPVSGVASKTGPLSEPGAQHEPNTVRGKWGCSVTHVELSSP